MGAGDGALAWEYLRRSTEYRAARGARADAPVYEAAPFPVRVQGDADLDAARFSLLAWEDPDRADGARSPFWAEAPMLDAELVQGARPLLDLLAGAQARIEGLRLVTGALVLKIERGCLVAQVRIPAVGRLSARAGLVVRLDYALPLPVVIERLSDLWGVAHGPAPRRGRVLGGGIASF